MAFGSVATLGTASSTTSGTTLALTTTAQLDAGNFGLLVIAKDNIGTTDADHSEVASVSDSAGNTYVKLAEFTNGNGTAATGVTVSVWRVKATSNLVSSGTVTATFANAIISKASTFWEFTIGSGKIPQVASGGLSTSVVDAGVPASMTISDLSNKEYLFVRGDCQEARSPELVSTYTNYTRMTNSVANAGTSPTSVSVIASFRILTATGDTNAEGATGGVDYVSVYLALEEVDEAPGAEELRDSIGSGVVPFAR